MNSETFREMALGELESMHRMAYHLTRNPDDANDLVQEAYLRAFRAENQFEMREGGIRPWLFKILHNCFYTNVQREKRSPAVSDDLTSNVAQGDWDQDAPAWDLDSLDWETIDDRLKHAIEELPETYRSVLLLWAVEGMKYREIAEMMDVPLGTIMSRLHRARSLLTEQLAELAAEQGLTGDRGKGSSPPKSG